MLLPNPDRGVIDPVKPHGYLLSASHPLGRFTPRFFARRRCRDLTPERHREDWVLLLLEVMA